MTSPMTSIMTMKTNTTGQVNLDPNLNLNVKLMTVSSMSSMTKSMMKKTRTIGQGKKI